MLIILFLVSHFNFLFIPCGRLSWLPVSFLLHVKYPLSYRIVTPFYLRNVLRKFKFGMHACTTVESTDTTKASRPTRIENDASARTPDQTMPRVTLTFNLLTSKLIVSCPCPVETTCVNFHKNQFICLQNILFMSLVTDERTDR